MGSLHEFRKTPHNDTFGVEIECYPTSLPYPDIYLGFFYCTTDGSLFRDGREFISQPLPFDMLITKIKKLHAYLGGWRTEVECGLHVHVSRKMWTPAKEGAFTQFLRDVCHKGDYYRGIKFREWFGRDVNVYCDPWRDDNSKYRAVNLKHENSYEFRMFAGGDLEWTLHTLRVVRGIVQHRGEWSEQVMDKLTQRGVKHEIVKTQDRFVEGVGTRVVRTPVRRIRATAPAQNTWPFGLPAD